MLFRLRISLSLKFNFIINFKGTFFLRSNLFSSQLTSFLKKTIFLRNSLGPIFLDFYNLALMGDLEILLKGPE